MNEEQTETTETTTTETEPVTTSGEVEKIQELIDLLKAQDAIEQQQRQDDLTQETADREALQKHREAELKVLNEISTKLTTMNEQGTVDSTNDDTALGQLNTLVGEVKQEVINFKNTQVEASWILFFGIIGAIAFKAFIDTSTRW